MKALAVLSNIVLLGFTCLVLATDHAPQETAYTIFTLLLLLIPVFTVFVIFRRTARDGRPRFEMKPNLAQAQLQTDVTSSRGAGIEGVAVACNIVLLGLSCWAFVDQYPHPEESGLIAFTVLLVLTPVLSALVLLRDEPGHSWQG